jgi:hypothetical protein
MKNASVRAPAPKKAAIVISLISPKTLLQNMEIDTIKVDLKTDFDII